MFLHVLLTVFQAAASKSTGFTLKLIPWDSPNSPLYQPNLTQTQKIHIMAMSSKARAVSSTPKNETFYANAIQIPVKNKGLQYSVNIRIGNPGTEVTLLLDTQHPLCQRAKNLCRCIKGQCVCTLKYGLEGGEINQIDAILSSDSFTLPLKNNGSRTFTNMIFGCANQSPVFSGILGMNKLPVSLISQVRNNVQGLYSYCLYGGHSYLRFGNDIPRVGKDVKTTQILYPSHPTMFLGLTDISVAEKRLGIPKALFSYEQGGFLIDTGAQFTVLKKQAYDRVIQAFANYYDGKLKRVNKKIHYLELCYKSNSSMKSYASMTFHLQGGADYVTSNLYAAPKTGIMCIGLVPGEVSILGAMQQWNTRFIFDMNMNVMKFVSEDCSKDRG
ncbi:hypothetical protein DH2020_008515 [Rehmannia glutinosa]|uniref:Peptidase A1 domain-containing protein n=1 Tax=Rehmannia glutinosa TaxID=99300 RepID=A0ABR0X3N1_REHGL